MIKQNIATLLETELDRKDFLKLIGLGFVAITGALQLVKVLTHQAQGRSTSRLPSAQDYGMSAYGGGLSAKN